MISQNDLDQATAAVNTIAHAKLQRVALNAIRADGIDDTPSMYFSLKCNWVPTLFAYILASLGCQSLWGRWPPFGSGGIALCIDVFAVILLVIVGLHADRMLFLDNALPHRLPALLITVFLLVGLVHAFGNMYLASGGIRPGGTQCIATPDASKAPTFKTSADAVYFSAVTLTTLGYGDFRAETSTARLLVVWQLASGLLLLILVVPLVVSRFAAF
jgi:Ion channel